MSAENTKTDTIAEHLQRCGVSRRDFIGFCGKLMVAAPFGLAITNFLDVEAVAAEIAPKYPQWGNPNGVAATVRAAFAEAP